MPPLLGLAKETHLIQARTASGSLENVKPPVDALSLLTGETVGAYNSTANKSWSFGPPLMGPFGAILDAGFSPAPALFGLLSRLLFPVIAFAYMVMPYLSKLMHPRQGRINIGLLSICKLTITFIQEQEKY